MDIDKNTAKEAPPQPTSQTTKKGLGAKLANNKFLTALIIVLIVGSISALAYVLTHTSKTKNQTNNTQSQTTNDAFMNQYGQGCQQRDVSFSSAPMRPEDLSFIRPLGAVSDGHVTPTDHVYIGNSNMNAEDNTYPVLMPANGTITDVSAMPAQYIGDKQGQKIAPEDHRIVISHSCRYFSIYIHIHKLGDKLKAAVGALQPNESKKVHVELAAGDIVGYIGNSTFDWIPIDTSKTLSGFITPKLYEGESWKIHTVSPFDLYTGSLKTELESKSLRTAPPIGGKIDYDQPGKLVGNWFRQGSGGYSGNNKERYWDGHLSIAPDYISPTSTIVSIGNWAGSAKQMVVTGTVDPANTTSSNGIVKYELRRLNYVAKDGGMPTSMYEKDMQPSQSEQVEGTILFQVLPDEKLKVEKFPGKIPREVTGFTDSAQMYER